MSVELITALGGGVSTVLGAVAVLLAGRSRRVAEDGRYYRRQAKELHRKFLAALSHINVLEEDLVRARRPIPERPKILEDEDDDGGTSQPVGANATP